MQCLVANAVQTFLIENPLGILSQNKDRIRIYLEVLVSTWGPTIRKSLNYIILVIMVLLPLIYYLVVYSINNFWALSLWQTLFYTLEIQWQTRDQDLLLWKESGNQEMFWWSKYQFLRMSRKGYLQCRKILLPLHTWARLLFQPKFSVFLTWVIQSVPNHGTPCHIHFDLCYVLSLVFSGSLISAFKASFS